MLSGVIKNCNKAAGMFKRCAYSGRGVDSGSFASSSGNGGGGGFWEGGVYSRGVACSCRKMVYILGGRGRFSNRKTHIKKILKRDIF